METKKLEVLVPKEIQEVSEFVQKVLKDIKSKKPIAEIVAGSLTGLIAAVDGYEKIGEEIKSDEASDCIALLGSGCYKALKS